MAAVGADCHRKDHSFVACEGVKESTRFQVPEPQGSVARTRREPSAAIRRYRYCAHPILMAREGAEEPASLEVPSLTMQSPNLKAHIDRQGSSPLPNTISSWPPSVRRSRPLCKSQSLSVPSCEPDRAWRPSGLMSTANTSPSWPVNVRRSWPFRRSHNLSSSSRSRRSRDGSGTRCTANPNLRVLQVSGSSLVIPGSRSGADESEAAPARSASVPRWIAGG